MVTVLPLPELKSLAKMARLLQKEKVISALAGFSASCPDVFWFNFIPSWDEVKMWTKLVNVYEARLRCKSHINAEKSCQLGETFKRRRF